MDDHGRSRPTHPTLYGLDTTFPIPEPDPLFEFPEHPPAYP
ncbi:hypothetical protein, partial [Pseudomonas paraeruginosa]